MPKASKAMFYAVKKGKVPGIYRSWAEVEPLISGFTGAQHRKFNTYQEAVAWADLKGAAGNASASPAGGLATLKTPSSANNSPPRPKPYQPTSSKQQQSSTSSDTRKVLKEDDVKDESKYEVVYTDGACSKNGAAGAVAGIGVWWGHNDPRNLSERCPGDQTNNRAELIAIIRCLETAPSTARPLLIKTDSSYSISCIRDWLPKWSKNGYLTSDKKPVKNIGVIIYLQHLLNQRVGARLQHIKGHAGHEGNEGADRLAVGGTFLPQLAERDWTVPDGENMPGGMLVNEASTSRSSTTSSRPTSNGSTKSASSPLNPTRMLSTAVASSSGSPRIAAASVAAPLSRKVNGYPSPVSSQSSTSRPNIAQNGLALSPPKILLPQKPPAASAIVSSTNKKRVSSVAATFNPGDFEDLGDFMLSDDELDAMSRDQKFD